MRDFFNDLMSMATSGTQGENIVGSNNWRVELVNISLGSRSGSGEDRML